jgi:uncharacterized protein (TIGR00661 family)
MDQRVSPKVLIAPLDWGLGHATRCIPIIRELIAANCTVLIAADGKVKALLEAEFPHLHFLHLPGYHIQYSTTAWGLPFKIVAQIPRLLRVINKEQGWLQKVVEEEKVDAVISDNRFGLYHSKILTVFITHQLQIKARLKVIEILLRKLNYRFISRFSKCWIPDAEGTINLAGSLSHPLVKPKIEMHYLGALSRFEKGESGNEEHLLILLSGPEPQRTILEKMLVEDLKTYKKPVVFVRGLPHATATITLAENVTVHNHLPSYILQEKIRSATFVISRCGYSTVMDIAATGKKAILIPTPGQTEQEYLAKQLMKKNFALCVTQKRFRLKGALELAQSFNYIFQSEQENSLKKTLQSLLKEIETRRNLF